MMGINFTILLPFLLFYYTEVSSAQTVLDVVTYTTKPVEELKCQFNASIGVQWIENQDGGGTIVLFSYVSATGRADKGATDEKYNNFDYLIDQESSSFNLLITNVDKDDGGRYVCSPFSASTVTFDVNVEVIPASIRIDCTASKACTSSAEREVTAQIVCVCMATGLSSEMLELEWDAVGTLTTSNTERVLDPTSGTISISTETTLPPRDTTSSLSCLLTGYKSGIPEGLRSDTYTFSPPVCSLTHECSSEGKSAVLICNCFDGSPKISTYSFYNSQMSPIGKQFYNSSTLKVEADGKDTFYCSGCNGLAHNQIAEQAFNCQQGSAWWIFIIIVILLLFVVAAIIFFVVRKHKQKHKQKHRYSKTQVDVENKEKTGGGGAETLPLNKNASVQDHPEPHDPGGSKPVSSAPKKENTGNEAVSSGGDPATNEDEKLKTGSNNETQRQKETTDRQDAHKMKSPRAKAPKEEASEKGDVRQEKSGPGVSKGEDDGNSEDKDNRDEENPAPTSERLQPEGQETTENGQPEKDIGSQVDSGERQSEKDIGSQVDSGKREIHTSEKAAGNQTTSHQGPNAEQYRGLPQGYNDSDTLANHDPVDVSQPHADMVQW